jgi:hypothetical protein
VPFLKQPKILRLAWLVFLSGMVPLLSQRAHAEASEYQVKGAYLFNFVKYVTWPADRFSTATSPIVIGILGDDPFGPALDEMLAKKTVNGRKIEVRREASSAEKLKDVHILFVSSSHEKRLEKILATFRNHPVVTVSDIGRFSRRGGMIGFVLVGRTVRFEIDVEPAKQAGLKLSGRLLSAATAVYSEQSKPGGDSSK